MTYPVLEIANKILSFGVSEQGGGELISNMKLQKLLYYVQGFHLAIFDEPLFEDEIEAWMYGPVVPSVYERYQSNGYNGIRPEREPIMLQTEEENLFNGVIRIYGDYSALGLMNLTHREFPWRSTATGKGNVIAKCKLQEFFRTRIA